MPSNYLSRIRQYDRRNWPRREVELLCRVVFTRKYIRRHQVRMCLTVDISEGGARIRVREDDMPDEFYLSVGAHELIIPCVVAARVNGGLGLAFMRELPTPLVDSLSRITQPYMTAEELFAPEAILAPYNPVIEAYNRFAWRGE